MREILVINITQVHAVLSPYFAQITLFDESLGNVRKRCYAFLGSDLNISRRVSIYNQMMNRSILDYYPIAAGRFINTRCEIMVLHSRVP